MSNGEDKQQTAPARKPRAGRGDQRRKSQPSPESDHKEGDELFQAYGAPDWPMKSYLGLIGAYNLAFAGFLLASRKTGRELPEQIKPLDILLLAAATHRMSRLLTKDYVTSPLRAPFTEYQGPDSGPAETKERARGEGLQLAIGEMLTCPWCASQWIASFLTYGFVLAPRVTRVAASILATVDVSDFLQLAYLTVEKKL